MRVRTKIAYLVLWIFALALLIGIATLAVVEPAALIMLGMFGSLILLAWAIAEVVYYRDDKRRGF